MTATKQTNAPADAGERADAEAEAVADARTKGDTDAAPRVPFRVDGHLDLASSSLGYDRDLTLDLATIRGREAEWFGDDEAVHRCPGTATVSLPALRSAGTRLCIASVIARVKNRRACSGLPRRDDVDAQTPAGAEAFAAAQLAWYERMHRDGHLRLVRTADELPDLEPGGQGNAGKRNEGKNNKKESPERKSDEAKSPAPLSVVLMLEGCDPIVEPGDAKAWFDRGVRVAGLAHYGRGRYAMGTGGDGPLTDAGKRLVPLLDDAGIALDLTHTADLALRQAMDLHRGAVCATHANCRELCDNDRQLTDEQIRAIADRGGVVGVVTFNPMIVPCPIGERPHRDRVTLDRLADHVDRICQITGSASHVAIGSDLDGGFGREAIPAGLDSIADLPRFADTLARRKYSDHDIAHVLGGNWYRWLRNALP